MLEILFPLIRAMNKEVIIVIGNCFKLNTNYYISWFIINGKV